MDAHRYLELLRRAALPLFIACLASTLQAEPGKSNVLFIMADDHAAHAIGAYGGRLAQLDPTPTIDRLAEEGILFTNAFCSNSICAPSRATILTGQYAHTHGGYDLRGALEGERQSLAIEMRNAGYQTAMIGKWHLKREPSAFDFYTVLPGQGAYHNPVFRVRGEEGWPRDTVRFEGYHSTDAITDIALQWLKNGRDRDKPFFLMHHYKAPHDYFEHAKSSPRPIRSRTTGNRRPTIAIGCTWRTTTTRLTWASERSPIP